MSELPFYQVSFQRSLHFILVIYSKLIELLSGGDDAAAFCRKFAICQLDYFNGSRNGSRFEKENFQNPSNGNPSNPKLMSSHFSSLSFSLQYHIESSIENFISQNLDYNLVNCAFPLILFFAFFIPLFRSLPFLAHIILIWFRILFSASKKKTYHTEYNGISFRLENMAAQMTFYQR